MKTKINFETNITFGKIEWNQRVPVFKEKAGNNFMMSIDSVCIASTGPPFIDCIVATCNK